MPRARKTIKLREGHDDPGERAEIRECLAYGRSVLGEPAAYGLRTLDDWARAWERYGDDVTALLAIEQPGTRPVALYVMGLIPRQRPARPMPANAMGFDIVRPDGTKDVYHYFCPAYFDCEAMHLAKLRVIDRDELALHRSSGTHARRCLSEGSR